jgi:hypothetical protein
MLENQIELFCGLLSGQNLLLERLSMVCEYGVGMLSFLSGIVLAFLFLFGLRLR